MLHAHDDHRMAARDELVRELDALAFRTAERDAVGGDHDCRASPGPAGLGRPALAPPRALRRLQPVEDQRAVREHPAAAAGAGAVVGPGAEDEGPGRAAEVLVVGASRVVTTPPDNLGGRHASRC